MKKIIFTVTLLCLFSVSGETQCTSVENEYEYETVDDTCKHCNPRPVVRLKTKEAF